MHLLTDHPGERLEGIESSDSDSDVFGINENHSIVESPAESDENETQPIIQPDPEAASGSSSESDQEMDSTSEFCDTCDVEASPEPDEESDESDGRSCFRQSGSEEDDESDESDGNIVDIKNCVITAIVTANLKPNKKPPDVVTEDYLVDISFHPSTNLISGASVSGDAIAYKYSLKSTEVVATYEVHKKACRAIEYSKDGDLLFTVSADKSIMVTDSATGKLKQFYDEAHEDPLYSLAIISEHLIATGDDNGVVRLWDLRQRSHVFSSKKMEDYVSKILTNENAKHLVCVGGDGSVTSFDIAAKSVIMQSELYEAEFTCAGLIRKETKLVVGSNQGSLLFYKWGEFGLHTDKLPFGNKKSINCLIPVSENIVLTGWEDGKIRATYLFPHQQLGIVGHHGNQSVEALDISHDGEFVASSSVDQTLRFWPISFFENSEFLSSINKTNNKRNLPSSNMVDQADFFSDLA